MDAAEQEAVPQEAAALQIGAAFLAHRAPLVPSLVLDLQHESVGDPFATAGTHVHLVLCLLSSRVVVCKRWPKKAG